MKDTVSRVGRITKYVVVPSELIPPVSQQAAGAVVKVTRFVGTKPIAHQAARVRSGVSSGVSVVQGRVANVRVTRLRVRRGPERAGSPASSEAPSGAPEASAPTPAPAPDAPDPSA